MNKKMNYFNFYKLAGIKFTLPVDNLVGALAASIAAALVDINCEYNDWSL
ncbi:hypothetical protein [Sulfolobus tengchongensis spindle-shaped virus 4]|nr:hypothetical protein [Sulfolobus tengchongensis spindle-shaped virus 4]